MTCGVSLDEFFSSFELFRTPSFEAAAAAFLKGAFPLEMIGVHGARAAFFALALARHTGGSCLFISARERDAEDVRINIEAFGGKAALFPSWPFAPYHGAPPLSPVYAARAALLSSLAGGRVPEVLIAGPRAFLTPLPPPETLLSYVITLRTGSTIDTAEVSRRLAITGYVRVPQVQMPGEFVLRGEVLDVYTAEGAFRVLFEFDTIESIRAFDRAAQVYTADAPLSSLDIPPVKEVIWDDERISTLERSLSSCDEFVSGGTAVIGKLIEELIEKRYCAGEEYFFPLAFEKPAFLTDYLPASPTPFTVFSDWERLVNAADALYREWDTAYLSAAAPDHPFNFPKPERLFAPFQTMRARAPKHLYLRSLRDTESEASLEPRCELPAQYQGNIAYLKEVLVSLVQDEWRIIIAGSQEAQTARLAELFKDVEAGTGSLCALTAPLTEGISFPERKTLILTEHDIFGVKKRLPASLKTAQSRALDSFVELSPGDPVVHINYGIGLFLGIERVKALGCERDYIKLRYADEEAVFVPIEQVNLVQRYIGNEGSMPRLDVLCGKQWEARKEKARRAAEELAGRLMKLYSRRKAAQGFAFPQDTEWQTIFEASFPWEETADQLRCTEEIKADMETPKPMDRLVCGDVGYGKTEVALRAAFKAVMGGKQVAFLAPTTILVEQHFQTFQKRFERFPIRVAMLSRFVDTRQIKKNLAAVSAGEIDILIGTHRMIQKDVVFKNLGLLVIDEEQRFGVRDKERFKELKANVDCLALSATPIPRTLHMSLLKIRDMSLLTTAPRNRLPIETHVGEYHEGLIQSAIRTEIARGGQVFFLHNRIESLEEVRLRLEKLVPEMLIETAHGQMNAMELEEVMRRFIQGGFHILVSTTIIENGIDIPNVNTIIIDRADMYGVAQLYQVRGRVGRSNRSAYAYLFYPKNRVLSELAMKRLEAMSDFTELGAGFKIAMKDMEIRGAGNLLGREQSGNIYSVGFDMYMRLLDTAIQQLQNEHYEEETEPLLELEYSGFIPDNYIAEAREKMELYKKIAAVRTAEELLAVQTEMNERFGPPPPEAASLLFLSEIRFMCKQLGVLSLQERAGMVRVKFARVENINIDRALALVRNSEGAVKIDRHAPDMLILKTGTRSLGEKSAFIREKLANLV